MSTAFGGGNCTRDLVLVRSGCCHAKFNDMTDDCEETTIPYPEVLKVLKDHGYNGYMTSEYEGMDKLQGGAWAAVRKQHVMMKQLLREG